jgi:acylphosphatase
MRARSRRVAGPKRSDSKKKRRAPARERRSSSQTSRPAAVPPPPPVPRPPVKEMRLLRIHGKVQGVGFRFFATRVARRLGLKGWIQNTRDGSVAAAVEGDSDAIDRWIEELREGPRYAEVSRIDQQRSEFRGQFGDFDVKF